MSTAQVQLTELANADKIWHLQQGILMEGLSLRELHAAAAVAEDLIFNRGEIIFRQGDPADAFYFLNRGTARAFVSTATGREKIVGVHSNGDLLGEDSVEEDALHQYQAVAHQESWFSLLPREPFMVLIDEIPRLALNLARLLNRKLGAARTGIEALSFSDTQSRIARTLLKLSSEHGKALPSRNPLTKLKISISHEHLAQLIGANRPHVSSIMSQFKKEGLIDYQKRKLLINVDRLSEHIAGVGA